MANSVYPPDPETDVGLIRVLLPDVEQYKDPQHPTDPASYMFEDWQLTAFLKLNGDKVKAAVAPLLGQPDRMTYRFKGGKTICLKISEDGDSFEEIQ